MTSNPYERIAEQSKPLVKPSSPPKTYTFHDMEAAGSHWRLTASDQNISYRNSWFGIPLIQMPEDIVLLQQAFAKVNPEAVVTTGIAHGGLMVFFASLMKLTDTYGPVIGVDIDIRPKQSTIMYSHPLWDNCLTFESDSCDPETLQDIGDAIAGKRTLVVLDSCHDKDHVLKELAAYSGLVTPGSYLVVCDTSAPPYGPAEAIKEWLRLPCNKNFAVDTEFDYPGGSMCIGGFLKREEEK